jgi:hypothetical protein
VRCTKKVPFIPQTIPLFASSVGFHFSFRASCRSE